MKIKSEVKIKNTARKYAVGGNMPLVNGKHPSWFGGNKIYTVIETDIFYGKQASRLSGINSWVFDSDLILVNEPVDKTSLKTGDKMILENDKGEKLGEWVFKKY